MMCYSTIIKNHKLQEMRNFQSVFYYMIIPEHSSPSTLCLGLPTYTCNTTFQGSNTATQIYKDDFVFQAQEEYMAIYIKKNAKNGTLIVCHLLCGFILG